MMNVDNIIQYVKDKEINIDIIATIPCGNASLEIIPKGLEYYFSSNISTISGKNPQ
jgi:hypothetical protein